MPALDAPAAQVSGSPSAQDRLFVYGTLRRGGSNDIARIAPDARFVSVARVRGRLYDVNGRWPALVLDDMAGWVTGEMYAVPPHAWPALDALEDPVTPQRPDGAYFKVSARVELNAARNVARGVAHGAARGAAQVAGDSAARGTLSAAASAPVTPATEAILYTANPATTPLTRLIASGDWMVYAAALA